MTVKGCLQARQARAAWQKYIWGKKKTFNEIKYIKVKHLYLSRQNYKARNSLKGSCKSERGEREATTGSFYQDEQAARGLETSHSRYRKRAHKISTLNAHVSRFTVYLILHLSCRLSVLNFILLQLILTLVEYFRSILIYRKSSFPISPRNSNMRRDSCRRAFERSKENRRIKNNFDTVKELGDNTKKRVNRAHMNDCFSWSSVCSSRQWQGRLGFLTCWHVICTAPSRQLLHLWTTRGHTNTAGFRENQQLNDTLEQNQKLESLSKRVHAGLENLQVKQYNSIYLILNVISLENPKVLFVDCF